VLAVLFAWVVVWLLQISGGLGRLSPEDQDGVSFYWQSLILPTAALGVMVLIRARANRHRPVQSTSLEGTGHPAGDAQGEEPGGLDAFNGLAVGIIPRHSVEAPVLFIGAVGGLGMWLAAMFLQRILAAWMPAGLAGAEVIKWSAVIQWVDPFKVGLMGNLPAPGGMAGTWLTVIFMVVISPVVAELFFRGYVLPLWAARWGWTGGLAGSALLSAVFSLTILGFPALFLAGIGLGWLARYGWSHNSPGYVVGKQPGQALNGWMGWMPAPLRAAWLAHTVFNLLMVIVWLWH
jgi:hypothetical protein